MILLALASLLTLDVCAPLQDTGPWKGSAGCILQKAWRLRKDLVGMGSDGSLSELLS